MDSLYRRNSTPINQTVSQGVQKNQTISTPKPQTMANAKPAQTETGHKTQDFGKVSDLKDQPPGESNPKQSLVATGMQSDSARKITGSNRQPQPQENVQQHEQQQQPYNANKDATEMYKSMHGGLTGWGTDEKSLFKTLEGKTPEQLNSLRAAYKDHYKKDLDADIKSELSGTDLTRAEALFKGNENASSADALKTAMKGMGTDEQSIYQTLQGKDKDQIEAIKTEYKQRHGKELTEDLRSEMKGDELKKAQALLNGDNTGSDAATLHKAISGLGTDKESIYKTLEGKNAKERAAIQEAYKKEYGNDLRADLKDDMSGAALDRANAGLDGNSAKTDAAKLRDAMSGMGTDEKAIWNTLEGKTSAERVAIMDEYRKTYGKDLRGDFKSEMGGNDLKRTDSLLEKGKLSDTEKLRYAMAGAGTDEQSIKETLAGKSKDEISALKADYQKQYGKDLTSELRGELSGRDEFDAMQDMKGKPQTTEEALQRMNESRDYERKGIRNFAGKKFVDAFSDKGKLLDDNTNRANAFYKEAMADGKMDTEEKKRLGELTGFVKDDVGTYREAKDSAGETAATVAGTAAAVAVVVGTAGTATPAVVAAGAAVAGAGTRVATKSMVGGRGYGWEDGLIDTGIGAVDGASTIVGAKAGTLAAGATLRASASSAFRKAGIESSERAIEMASIDMMERSALKRVATGAVEGVVDGASGGAMSGGAATAMKDGTWDQGFAEGMKKVGGDAATGAVMGAGIGGTIAGGIAAKRMPSHLVDESKIWMKANNENNPTRRFGSFDDMTDVNKALEPNPPVMEFKGSGDKIHQVKVYGAQNANELENIRKSVARMQDLGADAALDSTKEIHLRKTVGEFVDNKGKSTGETIGGLGGDHDGKMIISRESAATQHGSDHVVHHEVAHNIDASRGKEVTFNFTGEDQTYREWITEANEGHPFGKGQSVSDYGAKNSAEDFAETHRELIGNWERIKADPDRYIHGNGEIGQKFKWMMENVYGQKVPEPKLPQGFGTGSGSMMQGPGGIAGGSMMGTIPPDKMAAFYKTPEGQTALFNLFPTMKGVPPEQLDSFINTFSQNPASFMQGSGNMMGGGMMGGPAGT